MTSYTCNIFGTNTFQKVKTRSKVKIFSSGITSIYAAQIAQYLAPLHPTLAQIEASTILAKEATVLARPTNPLLTTDSRLNNLDTTISSRLPSSGYTSPPSTSSNASAVRTELSIELARIDATLSSRLPTSGYTVPPTAANNATAARAELATELARIDVTLSTRLPTSSYTAPDNADIAVIKAKTDNIPNIPAVSGEYTSAIAAIPVNPLLSTDTRLNNLDATVSSRLAAADYTSLDGGDITAIKAKTDQLTFTGTNVNAEINIDAASIAQEVLDAASIAPIAANVKKINDADVLGIGIKTDKWRGE